MSESEYLLQAAHECCNDILRAYHCWADKKPVMLLDIQEGRIYAYPYTEYRKVLTKRSQLYLKEQYKVAISEHKIVIFVRDNERRRLISFLMPAG